MAERAPGRGGAANVHANHVRLPSGKHVMYNVKPFTEPPFRKSLGCTLCTVRLENVRHESGSYWEVGGFFLYQGRDIDRLVLYGISRATSESHGVNFDLVTSLL